MASDFVLKKGAIEALLTSQEVAAELDRRAQNVASAASSAAPYDTGRLAQSHEVETVIVKGKRARSRVIAAVPYAATVAARTGYLGRALAEGGRQ